MTLRRLALAVAIAVTTTEASAQRQPAPFRSGVEIVYLDLTVTAPDGSIVTGLTKDDFEIFDEGVRHEVAVFSDKPEPISLGVLVDASISMIGDRFSAAVNAAGEVGRALQPTDLWSVFAFNSRLIPIIGWQVYDPSVVKALEKIGVGPSTELFKSVAEVVPKFRAAPHRKRALLVITDGADNALLAAGRPNRVPLAHSADQQGPPALGVGAGTGMLAGGSRDYTGDAVSALRSGEVLVYGLGMGWPQEDGTISDLHVPSLEKLAHPTGGGVAVARTMEALPILAKRLTDTLRQQYTVGFTPLKQPDGKYRLVKVVAKNPAYTVKTRAGYQAARQK
jgi:Ca-activated chloride channel family protein